MYAYFQLTQSCIFGITMQIIKLRVRTYMFMNKINMPQTCRITSPPNKLSNYFKNQSLKKSLRYSCAPHRLC